MGRRHWMPITDWQARHSSSTSRWAQHEAPAPSLGALQLVNMKPAPSLVVERISAGDGITFPQVGILIPTHVPLDEAGGHAER